MTLHDWVENQGRGELSRLARETGLAYTTVFGAAQGRRLKSYARAKLLSDATGGAVTIAELCEEPGAPAGEH